jgi:hypothetical protein
VRRALTRGAIRLAGSPGGRIPVLGRRAARRAVDVDRILPLLAAPRCEIDARWVAGPPAGPDLDRRPSIADAGRWSRACAGPLALVGRGLAVARRGSINLDVLAPGLGPGPVIRPHRVPPPLAGVDPRRLALRLLAHRRPVHLRWITLGLLACRRLLNTDGIALRLLAYRRLLNTYGIALRLLPYRRAIDAYGLALWLLAYRRLFNTDRLALGLLAYRRAIDAYGLALRLDPWRVAPLTLRRLDAGVAVLLDLDPDRLFPVVGRGHVSDRVHEENRADYEQREKSVSKNRVCSHGYPLPCLSADGPPVRLN